MIDENIDLLEILKSNMDTILEGIRREVENNPEYLTIMDHIRNILERNPKLSFLDAESENCDCITMTKEDIESYYAFDLYWEKIFDIEMREAYYRGIKDGIIFITTQHL